MSALTALDACATVGLISLNPQDRLKVRTSQDHPLCTFSEAFHRQNSFGEGKDPEFIVELWNSYRMGRIVALDYRNRTSFNVPIELINQIRLYLETAADSGVDAKWRDGTFTPNALAIRDILVKLNAIAPI